MRSAALERRICSPLLLLSILLCPLALPGASAQSLTVGGYQKVSETRITRTQTEYVYRASLTNTGPAIPGAAATVVSLSPATTIIEGGLAFGAVGTNASGASLDTFTFRHDRTVPFDFAQLQWTVTSDSVNEPPVADAGPDQTVPLGGLVQLDGSGSTDADGDVLTFGWSLVSAPPGSAAALPSTMSVNPTFTADVTGTYVVRLIVNDGSVDSAPDDVTIATGNSAPVADAGADRTAFVGDTVTLDGSSSTDADGDPLTFSWSFVSRPPASTAVLSDATAVGPTFSLDVSGTYVVQLIVYDGKISSPADEVSITTGNSAPAADAGPDQTVTTGQVVTLDGTGSSDANGDPLSFSWSFSSLPPGSAATLSNPAAAAPSFTADVDGTYVVQLIVNDGQADGEPDTVSVTSARPKVTLEATDGEAAEAGRDPGVLTFTRTGSTAAPLAVQFTIDGSAINGTDYDPIAGSLIIPAGSASVDLSVIPIDDATFELPETVAVTLSASAAYTIGTPAPATVDIADNDARVSVAVTDGQASESGADPGLFTIAREGPITAALTVFYVTSGTATGADYQALPGSVTIPAGATTATVTIVPIDDALFEGPETVVFTISPDPSYDTGLTQASVTITDDEQPAVTILATDDVAAEAGLETATFTVTCTGPTTGPLTVLYDILGTATNGTDYQLLTGSVTIPAGSATATITIAPVDDSLFEEPETVILTLSASPDYVVVVPGIAELFLLDDDGAVVTIAATDPAASEAGPDTGTFTLTRTGGDLSSPLLVLIARSGTANDGGDYASLGGFTFAVTIPANETSVTITIAPIADAVVEGDETVILTISPRAVYVIGTPGSATVTISDS